MTAASSNLRIILSRVLITLYPSQALISTSFFQFISTGSTMGTNTKKQKTEKPSDLIEEAYLHLEESIANETASASFVCGGTIPVKETDAGPAIAHSTSPVHIFWAAKEDMAARKLILPLESSPVSDSSAARLNQLVADCEPASFGRGKEDVIDPSYRKAGKLDPKQFASSFHPADFGITEQVERLLLPAMGGTGDSLASRELHAELYKLNVYSGPSGLFQKHVDTPRSQSQIGSLVVCLPSVFKGGNLLVRHHGTEVDFDWALQSGKTIQWAALYSDCEHEIKTITEGERVTLTYNLYVAGPEFSSIPSSVLDPTKLPLYPEIQKLFQKEDFMSNGGVLAIYCSHAYPHSVEEANLLLPRGLKGSDLVVYAVLKSFGIEVEVLPVIIEQEYDYGDFDSDIDELGPEAEERLYGERKENLKKQKEKVEKGGREARSNPYAHIGESLMPYRRHDDEEVPNVYKFIKEVWPYKDLQNITWISRPKHREMAVSFTQWGNEYINHTEYSYAAIVAQIPSFSERVKSGR
ncbi:uncharacterized protein N7477_001832 [Penicillium maclennaniae]|uniref:uncharacterized protein n=1 Tax=Penicillium maclennaniae TaxID=1343394 RepID=UPI002540FC62|nr:uncharacterized protein N7477_001832 [Penicillium maclennaniae]KAJ5681892.1 hypothetical protein N7477_001832 [Penicillium maclennaniae]